MRLVFAALLLAGAAVAAATPSGGVRDAAVTGAAFPATLAEFGFFADAGAAKPAAGVVPYRLNTALWSDGADKHRFLYLPLGVKAVAKGEGLLDLPVGAALIKTFAFGARKIETRVLLHREDGWVALPYKWNEAQTEARLVLAGARVPLTTPAGQAISYAVPNKNQCKECHSLNDTLVPIGPKALNMVPVGQDAARHFTNPAALKPTMPRWDDAATGTLDQRARAYLDINCAHCHNPAGSASNSGLFLGWDVTNTRAVGIGKRPVAAGRGSGGHDFAIAPGHPDASIMIYRLESTEPGVAMPELGRSTVHREGADLLRQWIAAMPKGGH